jgi:hypothetical protein
VGRTFDCAWNPASPFRSVDPDLLCGCVYPTAAQTALWWSSPNSLYHITCGLLCLSYVGWFSDPCLLSSRRRLRSAQEGGRSVKGLPPPSYIRVCRCSSSMGGD